MAVSALNMTPYFAGYPFQGKHRRRSITNYLNYDYKTSQVSRADIVEKVPDHHHDRAFAGLPRKREIITRSLNPLPLFFSLLRHPFCLSGNHDQLFDLLIVITTCSSHNIPDFADFLARSLASLFGIPSVCLCRLPSALAAGAGVDAVAALLL